MGINANYMIAPSLQEVFVDKATGLPLSAGLVYFYSDNNRSTPKNIYTISGTPPNYTYTALPNPVTLTSSGTFSDGSGNDIIPYYYPFDANGNPELYFIQVYNSGNVFQFSRQAYPNFSQGQEIAPTLENFIPNGQFLLHWNGQVWGGSSTGQIPSSGTVQIAPPGWYFSRPNTSAATDFVTFPAFGSFTANPDASPQYAVQIQNTITSPSDTYKYLYYQWNDVNKFASSTQQYTFAFWAQSNTGNSIPVQIQLIKNFGSGGSTSTTTTLANITLTPSYGIFQTSFTFGTNVGKTLGAGHNVQIALNFPTNATFNASLVNFVMTINNVTITNFPPQTDSDFIARSQFYDPPPDAGGANLYLPIIQGPSGYTWDTSVIGNVEAETQTSIYSGGFHPTVNKLLANGQTLNPSGYSSLGIPFSRLWNVYYNQTLNIPIWGTGSAFATAAYPGSGSVFRIVNNTMGSVTATADGTATTGFTFLTVATGYTSYTQGFLSSTTTPLVYLKTINPGIVADATAGTSGFTVNILKSMSFNSGDPAATTGLASIQTTSSTGLGGKYFTFQAYNSGAVSYYVWYKVNGAGADPAPGGTGILVNLDTGDSASIVAQKTMEALNGFQSSEITTVSGGSLVGGHYFTFNATGAGYYVWYTVNGVGSDPAVGGRTGIKVAVLSTDTAAQIASKTFIAINSFSFAVPKLQDYFLRGWNNTTDNYGDRLSIIPGIWGNLIGTLQQDSIYDHYHNYQSTSGASSGGGPSGLIGGSGNFTNSTGLLESRPINIAVNFAIRY